VQVDDSAFGQIVAAESGRLARLATLLTGDRARGRELTEVALARALLGWRRLHEEEPGGALRRVLFEVYGEWWHRRYRRYAAPAPEAAPAGTGRAGTGRAGTSRAGTSRAGTSRAGTDRAGTDRAGTRGAGQPAGARAGPVAAGSEPAALADQVALAEPSTGAGPVADPVAAELAAMTPRQRSVALMDAEGRSEPEMVELLGLSDRAVARSRPLVPMPELAAALSTVDAPVPLPAVAVRAARIRRRRRITGWVVAVLLVALVVPVLRALGGGPDPAEAARQCPTRLPARVSNSGLGLEADIVPITPARTYLCRYSSDGSRSDAKLVEARAGVQFVAAFNAARVASSSDVCSRETVTPFVLRVVGGDRTLTLLALPGGCGRVTNGVRTVSAGRDLLAQVLTGRPGQGPEPALLSCAGLDPTVRNEGAGLDRRLVGFTGMRIVVCPKGVAATVGEVVGEEARLLAAELDSAPTRRATAAGCPSSKRLVVVVSGVVERVDIAMDASGCGWASNGVRVVELDRAMQNALRTLAQLPPI